MNNKIKTILVNPPFSMEEIVGETKSMKDVMNIIQPLGIAYIAAVLEKEGYDVKIAEGNFINHEQIKEYIKQEKPDVVGITSTTPTFESVIKVARDVKEIDNNIKIIVGGSHVTALPQDAIKEGCFDVGVIGEGEITFLELIKTFEKDSDLKKVNGIVYKEKNKIKFTKPREFIKDLDSIPFPARHLLPPLKDYHPTPASYRKLPLGVLMTSRGCPYQCTFCDRAIFGTTYRFRSAKNVVDEIEELINKYGAKELKFFDDTFTLDKKRLYEIFDLMKERGIKIGWCCLTRTSNVTKEMLQKMKDNGCWQILYGLESGDDRMLQLLKKGTTVAQNEQAVKWAHEVGLSVRADFIVGTPGDSLESMQKTLDFAIKMNMDFAHFNKFTPYPGTELYKMLINKGYNFDFSKSCSQLDHSIIMYVPDGVDKEKYKKFIDGAYKKYYLRPKYLAKQVMNIRSFEDIKRYWAGFKAITGI
jgi:radical SAM superfamily enzyme YgiQ (UPF0313 family)